MGFNTSLHPGKLSTQLGYGVSARTEAIRTGQRLVVYDLSVNLIDVCSPKLDETQEAELEEIMAPALRKFQACERGKEREMVEPELLRACSLMVRRLLRMMAAQGIYAWPESKASDATDLALGSDEVGAEAA